MNAKTTPTPAITIPASNIGRFKSVFYLFRSADEVRFLSGPNGDGAQTGTHHLQSGRFRGEYVKLTEAAYIEQIGDRLEKSLHKRAKQLGYQLTKIIAPSELETPLGA